MELVKTRRALHAVAEYVLAGPQYRASGTIRLRIVPGGFATVAQPDLRVEVDQLVAGGRRIPLDGSTPAALAAAAGVTARALRDVYHDGVDLTPDDTLLVDRDAAAHLAESFHIGDQAVRRLAPDAQPVLWPEHFDVGVSLDEVNYGVSPGDQYLAEPYAYVGPWQTRQGAFWNAPFGAARTLAELRDPDGVLAFFRQGRDLAAAIP